MDDYINKKGVLIRSLGVWIPILFLVVVLYLSSFHDTFEEWDGVMQYFAGTEILRGFGYNGWTSHFWPPLYPFLIGLISLLLPGFQAAKIISIIAGTVTMIIAYCLAIELSGSKKVGFLAQVFLFLNPLFLKSTLQAENHMIDTMFFVMAIFFLLRITNMEDTNIRQILSLGIITGLAGLSRYTSYALVPIIVVSIILFLGKRRFSLCATFLIGFVAISLPWWIYNTATNGSPFHTWQYLNIGSHVFPDRFEWWWDAQSDFNGIADIAITYPIPYIKNFVSNVFGSGKILVYNLGILAPFLIPAIFDSFISIKFKKFFILFGQLVVFVSLVSQAFVFNQVFLSWVVIFTVLCIMFLLKYIALSEEKYGFIKEYHLETIIVILLALW